MRKKVILIIMACCILWRPAGQVFAADMAIKYYQIDDLVEDYNRTLESNRISLEALMDSDEDTEELEKNIKLKKIQLEQTQAKLINEAQNAFIQALQVEEDIKVQDKKVSLSEKSVQIARVRLQYGLITKEAFIEADLQLSTAKAEQQSLKNQKETLLSQLKNYLGLEQENLLELSPISNPNLDYLGQIDLEADCELAVKQSYARRLLRAERSYVTADEDKERYKMEIDEQEQATIQAVKLKYNTLLEMQTRLSLKEEQLKQAEKQLQAAEIKYNLGGLSVTELENQQNDYEGILVDRENAHLDLFMEIENYKALVDGLS